MDKINEHKTKYLRHLASVQSLSQSWIFWEHEIRAKLSSNPTGSEILSLGDSLSDIFYTTNTKGRGQEVVSGAGAAWECLISWYLNLVCWNTPVMIIKQKKAFVPPIISDSLSVTISNNQTNTESDIVMFSIPLSDTEVL